MNPAVSQAGSLPIEPSPPATSNCSPHQALVGNAARSTDDVPVRTCSFKTDAGLSGMKSVTGSAAKRKDGWSSFYPDRYVRIGAQMDQPLRLTVFVRVADPQ